MGVTSGVIFFALLLGSLALPTPDAIDNSIFFDNVWDSEPDGRIVGGTQAAVGSHPWMASMSSGFFISSFLCGGSVISQRTILTAAHCIDAVFSFGSLSSSLRIGVGSNRWSSGGQRLSVSRNVTHLHYLSSTIKNDIGILITASDIVFNQLTAAVPLSFAQVDGGVPVRAAGWGRISATGAIPADLLEVDLFTLSGTQCVDDVISASAALNVRAPPVEPHIELCTFHSVGRGVCRGDSGSALVQINQGTQVGIVSWGFPCALGAPDMFVRVSAFADWLRQHVV